MAVYLFLCFENTVGHHTIENVRGFAQYEIAHTVARIFIDDIHWQTSELSFVSSDIERNLVFKGCFGLIGEC